MRAQVLTQGCKDGGDVWLGHVGLEASRRALVRCRVCA
jgi:hypothetical protein